MGLPAAGNRRKKQVQCSTWQASPELAKNYLEILPLFGSNAEMSRWAEGYVRGHAGRLKWDVKFLTENYSFDNCLNVGAAPFLFEYIMSTTRPDLELASLDLDVRRFPKAAEILNTKIIESDIEQMSNSSSGPPGEFHCVVFCEIFEHLRIDLLRTMETVASLLTDHGILYLTMPNGLGLSAWLTKLAKGRTGPDPVAEWRKLSSIGHMGHVREYSALEVREVLHACGLEIDRCFFRRQSSFHGTVRSRLRDAAQLLTTRLIPSLGDEIVVVARKKVIGAPTQ